ncbi:MAG: hypothetical protein KAS30_01770 [Candidatus Diapherotrites archaeon]|nr:hypothetical protein [Candidatus Diapherotrites archaeon]
MARVTLVKKARKDYPDHDIKKGESYYWWKFRNSPKQFSKTQPKPQQLTQSAFFSSVYDIQDMVDGLGTESFDSLQTEVEGIIQAINELGESCQESLDNMPESLQESPTGELLQERVQVCEDCAGTLEGVNIPDEREIETEEGETMEETI